MGQKPNFDCSSDLGSRDMDRNHDWINDPRERYTDLVDIDTFLSRNPKIDEGENESPLEATATHRNKETDPNDRARVGFKVDAIFEYQDISWTPVIECRRCPGTVWWSPTVKTNRRKCKWYSLMGLTVVGRKIRVCALATTGGLFHLVLMHECLLPTS
ncbi:251_t:CDS:2 [Rhizophagus irregularis]|nr:251_t:CDS:2 [Rhizophagus irregularis]